MPFEFDDGDEWTDAEHWLRFPVCEHLEGMQAFFDVRVAEKGGRLSLSETDLYRFYCHAVLQHLPDAAFGEAVEALNGMYEFYRDSPPLLAPPPVQSVKGKITGSYISPVYPILGE